MTLRYLDTTPESNDPCPRCQRYTCRCSEPEDVPTLRTTASRPIDWTPWMAARAANV